MQNKYSDKYPLVLLSIYAIIWIILAIKPKYRSVWIDENILVFLFLIIILVSYKKFRLSNTSYTCLFIFMVLHSIGAHYSYSEMPLFDILKDNFKFQRNHYDRLIHFLFGVLWFFPTLDILTKFVKIKKGIFVIIVTILIISGFKGIFEVIEYLYTWIKNSGLTTSNYLGEQGDSLDALKDIILGIFGAVLSGLYYGIKSKIKK